MWEHRDVMVTVPVLALAHMPLHDIHLQFGLPGFNKTVPVPLNPLKLNI